MVNSDENRGETQRPNATNSELDAPGSRDWPDICIIGQHAQPLDHLRQHDQAMLREAQGCQP